MSDKHRQSDNVDSLVGEAMGDIVDEAANERSAKQLDAERQERSERRNGILAATLVPLALVLTALNLSGYSIVFWASGPSPLSAAEAERAALQVLSDAVDELQWYQEENGRYPVRPGFLPPEPGDDEPFDYTLVANDRYTLTVTIEGRAVSFDSQDDAEEVFREVRSGR